MLFAEEMSVERLVPPSNYDVTAEMARLRRPRPTGTRDKILVVTSRYDDHADAVVLELVTRGLPVFRFDVESWPDPTTITMEIGRAMEGSTGPAAENGRLVTAIGELSLGEVRAVWLRRRIYELFGLGPPHDDVGAYVRRESDAMFAGAMSFLGDAFWISPPASLHAADSKIAQLRVARDLGLTVPRTIVTNDPARASEFLESTTGAVVKSFRGQLGATLESTRLVYTQRVRDEHLAHLGRVRHSPCLFQEAIPKRSDLRVTVIGGSLFATEIETDESIEDIDWRRVEARGIRLHPVELPEPVAQRCRRMVDHFGLQFAGIDLVRTPGDDYVFLELNTHGDWLWLERATGQPFMESMADLLQHGAGGA